MKTVSKLILALATVASLAGISTTASAETDWQRHHPRQAQVMHRVHRQEHRINRERREGEISRAQAHRMRARDHAIARQNHAEARANGGHITPGQQRQMNHELNQQSREIGR